MPETRPWISDSAHRREGDYDRLVEIVFLQSMVIVLAGALLYQALARRVAAGIGHQKQPRELRDCRARRTCLGTATALASQRADEPGADEGQQQLLKAIEATDTGIGTISKRLAERIATVERKLDILIIVIAIERPTRAAGPATE